MQKDNSLVSQQTILSNLPKSKQKPNQLLQNTLKAYHYYRQNKQKQLQQKRLQYLKQVSKDRKNKLKEDKKQLQNQRIVRETKAIKNMQRQYQNDKNQKNQVKQLEVRRSTRNKIKNISYAEIKIQEQPPVKQKKSFNNNLQAIQLQSQNQVLEPINTYPIKRIHQTLLNFQKAIDSFLDFKYNNRRQRNVPYRQLLNYLHVTRYGINSEIFFEYLSTFNKNLYQYVQGDTGKLILTHSFTNQKIEQRKQMTKERMTRIKIQELDLL